jgi:myo-inositol-1(or 4)-monophosphatase
MNSELAMPDLNQVFLVAEKAAREGGRIVMSFRDSLTISYKDVNNLVTQADVQSEEAIRSIILTAFAHHSILGEESGLAGTSDAEHLWIVDPLDGTNNYAYGIPHFSVSVAYAYKGIVMVGVVFDPMRNELFCAIHGKGATLNGTAISCSTRLLDAAVVCTGFYYERGIIMEETLEALSRLLHGKCRDMRRTGGAALDLCWVACGRFDAFFEYLLSAWDFAAGMLIIKEAGGCTADPFGNDLTLLSPGVITASNTIFNPLLELVRRKKQEMQ